MPDGDEAFEAEVDAALAACEGDDQPPDDDWGADDVKPGPIRDNGVWRPVGAQALGAQEGPG